MLEQLKKGLPLLGTSGVTVLVLYGLLAGQVQQANTRADSAMLTAAQSKGVIDGIDKNLKWFMLMNGVDPIDESVPAETVTVWRYIDVRPDSAESVDPNDVWERTIDQTYIPHRLDSMPVNWPDTANLDSMSPG